MMRRRTLTILLLTLAACGQDATTPPAGAEMAEMSADQVMFGLDHKMTREGLQVALLNADTAYLHEEGRRFDLVGVRLDFFNANGSPSGHLTSRTGEYRQQEQEFVARGDVVLITQTPEGERRLETDELFYNVRGDRLWSVEPFVMTEQGRVTRGASFESDGRFNTWSVTGAQTEGGLPEDQGISF